MVALTYSRGTLLLFIVLMLMLLSKVLDTLPVYRSCKIRKVRKPAIIMIIIRFINVLMLRLNLLILIFVVSSTLEKTKDLAHEYGKIGVCYYKDYQGFAARLRLNLKRHYNYEGKLFIYACSSSELGLSGRISTCLFSVKSQRKHSCVLPSLRVGRFLIYHDSREPLKEVSKVHLMLHRTLISLLSFHLFLKITSNRNIRIPKVLAFNEILLYIGEVPTVLLNSAAENTPN